MFSSIGIPTPSHWDSPRRNRRGIYAESWCSDLNAFLPPHTQTAHQQAGDKPQVASVQRQPYSFQETLKMFFARRRWATRVVKKTGFPIRSLEATELIEMLIWASKQFPSRVPVAESVLMSAMRMV